MTDYEQILQEFDDFSGFNEQQMESINDEFDMTPLSGATSAAPPYVDVMTSAKTMASVMMQQKQQQIMQQKQQEINTKRLNPCVRDRSPNRSNRQLQEEQYGPNLTSTNDIRPPDEFSRTLQNSMDVDISPLPLDIAPLPSLDIAPLQTLDITPLQTLDITPLPSLEIDQNDFNDHQIFHGLDSLTLNTRQQPWNILQWLETSESQIESKKEPHIDESMFLPPLPCPHRAKSERSYCSGKSTQSIQSLQSSVTSASVQHYHSGKSSARSSCVAFDSETEAARVRCRHRRRNVRRPARYLTCSELDGGESDSTLAESTSSVKPKAIVKPKVPRYKRPSHINAENKRRTKIKTGFEGLEELLPISNIPGKDTQVQMLFRGQDFIRQLHEERSDHHQELEELRYTVHNLTMDIRSLQADLPDEGLNAPSQGDNPETNHMSLDELFHAYVKNSTEKNWKFWIFSYLIRPLYYSYKKAVTCDLYRFNDLASCVKDWMTRDMALSLLRPGSLKALCSLSKTSSVMTDPGLLPQEAAKSINKPSTKPTDSGYSSAS